MNASGHLIPVDDNVYDIGGTGPSERPRDFYLGRNMVVGGTSTLTGAATLSAALDHDGTTAGFYGITPATRPTAFTQTYATATKTHSALTLATLTDSTGGTPNDTLSAIVGGGAGCENTTKNAIATLAREQARAIVDIGNIKQVVNALIDDFQLLGLAQ